jgi:hypothetical protein
MEPTPEALKKRRHCALIRAIDEMCDRLRCEVSDPTFFAETEDTLWTDEFFRAARCDLEGLRIECWLKFFPAVTGNLGGPLNSGTKAAYNIDREIFAGTGRREHEELEMLKENLAAGANTARKPPK